MLTFITNINLQNEGERHFFQGSILVISLAFGQYKTRYTIAYCWISFAEHECELACPHQGCVNKYYNHRDAELYMPNGTKNYHALTKSVSIYSYDTHIGVSGIIYWTRMQISLSSPRVSMLFTATNVLYYFLHAIIGPEHTIPLKTIIDRSFNHCHLGRCFLT